LTLDQWAALFAPRHHPGDQDAALSSCLALIAVTFLATLAGTFISRALMPRKIGYHRPAGQPSAAKLYQRQASRLERNRFYASTRWVKLRKAFLAENPVCTKCNRELATHAHHVKPRETHPDLQFDWDNLAPRCQPCHNAEEVR
jgi:hypothetical protein